MKVVISGYYGFNNAGDEAILASILDALKKEAPETEITVLSKDPPITEKEHSVKAVRRFSLMSILKSLWESDLLLSGGGGLLQDTTSIKSPLYYLGIVFLARLMRKKVMFYAQGIGPLKHPLSHFLTKHIGNMVNFVTVRDEASKNLLRRLGVRKPQIEVTTDPVFAMEPAGEEEISELFQKEGIAEGNYLGVSVRDWKTDVDYPGIISKVCEVMSEKYNLQVIFIPMHYPEDMDFSRKLWSMMKNKSHIISGKYHPKIIMGILGKMDIVITMRLHGIIMASATGVPSIALSYDPKVKNISEQIGLEYIELEEINVENLSNLAFQVYENRKDLSEKIKERVSKLKDIALSNARYAKELMNK